MATPRKSAEPKLKPVPNAPTTTKPPVKRATRKRAPRVAKPAPDYATFAADTSDRPDAPDEAQFVASTEIEVDSAQGVVTEIPSK